MALLTWLDDRTGYKGFVSAALYEHVPGGARWRYVWGSTLVFAFAVQMVTGLFLWMHYSPSSQTAWESVYYIQHEMYGGWLLRGIHHYTAQVMIVLLALHMLQVIVDGAYRAPREVNFWLGLILLMITLGLSLTGYLLPWDQKGYWATKVATNLTGVVPGAGPVVQRLVVGGADYGHHTLTRFFALHAGLLPFLMIVFISAHVYVFRRHGLRHKEPRRAPDSYFWPDQVLRDAVACLGVLVVVLLLCLRFGLSKGFEDPGHLGAELGAPADPSEPYDARPEWYFLFLFQFLKYFPGKAEIYGAVVVPGVVMGLLFLMPLIGRWRVGHWFNVALTVAIMTGVVVLTAMALVEDAGRPHLDVPWLGSLPAAFTTVVLAVLVLAVFVLLPLITRERSFRFNVAVLVGIFLVMAFLVLVVVAGGGVPGAGRQFTVRGYPFEAHRVLLTALLAELVLLITIVLLKSPVRTRERLAADRAVTAAADAQAAEAAIAHGGGDDAADLAGGSWVRWWEFHHRWRLGLVFLVLAGAVLLTAVSVVGGAGKPGYRRAVAAAQREAERVVELASFSGIPPHGAVSLLRNDPATQGPKLFARNCASCHRFNGHDGTGNPVADPQSAPDLYRFATRDWIGGMLRPEQVDSVRYFGPHMKAHRGKMVEFVKEEVAEATDDEDKRDLANIVIALSAEANLPEYREADARDAAVVAAGREAMSASVFECTNCHAYRGEQPSLGGANRGPDLTGYGSRQWLVDAIRNIQHPRFYPGDKNDRMPLYGEQKILDDHAIGLIADWLRGDVGGRTAGAPAPTVAAAQPTTGPAATTPSVTTAPAATAPASTAPATTAPAPKEAPAEPKPAVTRPAETKPAEPMPVPPKPADPAPPAPTQPAPAATEPKPVEPKPAEPPPAETEPFETEFEVKGKSPGPSAKGP